MILEKNIDKTQKQCYILRKKEEKRFEHVNIR